MLKQLRQQNQILLEQSKLYSSHQTIEKHLLIKSILADDACFFRMKMEDAYSLLSDLGYSIKEVASIYSKMISPNEYLRVKDQLKNITDRN